jgi:hypothetical protein
MERLVNYIKKRISEVGSFNAEYALESNRVKYNGGTIEFYGTDFIKVLYDNERYVDIPLMKLGFDDLLDILNVVMMYSKKIKYYENYMLNKNKTPQFYEQL